MNRPLPLAAVLLALSLLAPLVTTAAEPASLPAPAEAGAPLGVAPPEALAPEVSRSLRDWYELGGAVMHLLVACSVLVLALALERAWRLRRGAVAPGSLAEEIGVAWDPERPERVREICERHPSSLARIVVAGLDDIGTAPGVALERVSEAGQSEVLRMRRNLPLLAAVGNVATMLGLLGTVLGMIEAFDLIAEVGTGDARVVARGIFQALVTTAAGLGIGIVAVTLHAVLRRRADAWILTLEDTVTGYYGSAERPLAADEPLAAPDLAPASR